MKSMVEDAQKSGRAKTLFGRYRELPDIRSSNFNRRSFAERTAMNTPIQGTAADIIKIAMIRVNERLKTLLKETMESVVELKVPLIADVHEGKNWAEAK